MAILQFDEYRSKLLALKPTLEELSQALGLEAAEQELDLLQAESAAEGFWNDMEHAQKVTTRIKNLQDKIDSQKKRESGLEDLLTLCEMGQEMEDESLIPEISEGYEQLVQDLEKARLATLFTGEYDHLDCMLTIHAGAGGTEAQDWADMLFRMYTRWAERQGFKWETLDYEEGDEAGIKSATIMIEGENAYGFLRGEHGVHRLVRISPFDANARRHTSFASLDVAPIIEDDGEIEIRPEDLRIDTYRASGAGGQHVNRTDSAVRITHLPTGVVVQCQNERSQVQNKETCFRMLRAKLAELKEKQRQEQMGDIKGEQKKIEWGSQIRSYVFQPYTMVKDLRTGYEMGDVSAVMDGKLEGFVTAYLQMMAE